MRVLSIDPGGQTTGIVVREGRRLVAHALVHRGQQPLPVYLDAVLEDLQDLYDGIHPGDDRWVQPHLAVEGLNPPTPHLGLTSVTGLLDTAQILGGIHATWGASVLIVPPGGHGKVPAIPRGRQLDAWMAQQYPAALIGPREYGGAYGGRLRHARSAWDVAGAAATTIQLRHGATTT